MPEKLLIRLLKPFINFLIILGTPPLFAIKIFFWTILWSADLVRKFLVLLIDLIAGVGEVTVWLIKTIIIATFQFVEQFFLSFKNLITKSSVFIFQFLKKINIISGLAKYLQKSLQSVSLPKITIKKPGPVLDFLPDRPTSLPNVSKSLQGKEKIFYFLLGSIICFFVLFVPYWIKDNLDRLPNPVALSVRDIPVSTRIYDRNKILLYRIYSGENRTIVSLSDIPKNLVNATIAIEDTKFYEHFGIDPKGIVRAFLANGQGGELQGASTLTQQLVRSALLTPDRTLGRKIKEALLSFWAERIYSKKQILEMYFNQIPYGGSAYGVEAASQTYFGKHVKDLTLAEAAALAGLPAAPTIYSPYGSHPELAKQRQIQVLSAMVKQGYISEFDAKEAASEDLKFAGLQSEIKAPHFVMYVKDYLVKKYGIREVEQGGLEVVTSLDYPTYERVAQLLKDGVKQQSSLQVGNGAAMVTNPKNGEILAMVGSTDYFDTHNGNVNVTLAERSPGSSIKPLVYAYAFDKGIIMPSTILDDSPSIFNIEGSPPYIPQNYDNRFHGKISARVALASSFNIPAVKVMQKVGVANFINFAQTLGITTLSDPSRYGLSLSLGGGEIKMEDMVSAFSAFANNGDRTELKPVLLISDYQGKILEDNREKTFGTKVISSKTAFLISNILADDSARAPTFGSGSYLNIANHSVSVKTGTTQDKRDNWTIGYTPTLLAAVWVGNNDNSPMSPALESGRTGAAAIWNPIMTQLLANHQSEPITLPDDIVSVPICAVNGLLTCQYCPNTVTEYFTKGTEPKLACNFSKEELEKIIKDREAQKTEIPSR